MVENCVPTAVVVVVVVVVAVVCDFHVENAVVEQMLLIQLA